MLGSLVEQAMEAQSAAAVADTLPDDDNRDWESEAGDGADANDTGEGPVNEKPGPASRRDLMLMSSDELEKRTKQLEEINAKKFGASKTTLDMLRMMSADAFNFITLCEEWEAGKSGIRTLKKQFQNALLDDPTPRTEAMNRAWNNRSESCKTLKQAVLIALKTTLEALKTAQAQGDGVGASLHSIEAQELKKAVEIINERQKTGCKAEGVVKDAFGFCKQQEASEQASAERRRRGEEIPTEELYRRWPCLAPGWSISAERDAKRVVKDAFGFCNQQESRAAAAASLGHGMPRNEGLAHNAQEDFIADTFGAAAASSFQDRRYASSPPRAQPRTNALSEDVQAYSNGKRPALAQGGQPYKKKKPSDEGSSDNSDDDFL
jgi:hypothetical protein